MRAAIIAAVAAVALAFVPALPAAQAATTVQPGDQLYSEAGQCTANFVYAGGGATYIGLAAHCFGTGGPTETNGCDSGSLPLGAEVRRSSSTGPVIGTLAYSSWLTMQGVGEDDFETCEYNDLALIKLNASTTAVATMPYCGGPRGTAASVDDGENICSIGNSGLRQGQLREKDGFVLFSSPEGWSHQVYTVTPGIPGDSGSGFVDSAGAAFGVLSTMQFAPYAASNGVSNLSKMLAYAAANGTSVSVVNG